MTPIQKYNQINSSLEKIISKKITEVNPVIDTSLPFVRDSEFIKYITSSFFMYKRVHKGMDKKISENKKMELIEQFNKEIKHFKKLIDEYDSKIKQNKRENLKLDSELKKLTKEDDELAQTLLNQIQTLALNLETNKRVRNGFERCAHHYSVKLSKLRNNDKKFTDYVLDSLFIEELIYITYATLDKKEEMIQFAKSDIAKIDAICKEKQINYPTALLSQITFNKQYKDIIEQLDAYNQILVTFIGLEIISDFMDDKITLDDLESSAYWDIPVINDILNPEEVKKYTDFIEEKYNKVHNFYLSRPIFFKKNDLLHIKSVLQYVYKVILSPGATLILAQELDDVKTSILDKTSSAIYQKLYDTTIMDLRNKIFKDIPDEDDFFRKYILLILLTTTSHEDLIARIEVM